MAMRAFQRYTDQVQLWSSPLTRLKLEKITKGLLEFNKSAVLLVGELDPSLEDSRKLVELEGVSVDVIQGSDHHFSGIHTSFFYKFTDEILIFKHEIWF